MKPPAPHSSRPPAALPRDGQHQGPTSACLRLAQATTTSLLLTTGPLILGCTLLSHVEAIYKNSSCSPYLGLLHAARQLRNTSPQNTWHFTGTPPLMRRHILRQTRRHLVSPHSPMTPLPRPGPSLLLNFSLSVQIFQVLPALPFHSVGEKQTDSSTEALLLSFRGDLGGVETQLPGFQTINALTEQSHHFLYQYFKTRSSTSNKIFVEGQSFHQRSQHQWKAQTGMISRAQLILSYTPWPYSKPFPADIYLTYS